ncbi:hypothetical protein DYB37_009469 [Aphanomyces astaci]|uniref:Uncharacterized protein n=1 Tax=Aphanomyces astaci TaxID=112090 RepID=A0A3R7AZU1_APHAT|nr:hypothetical protein DYB37_009469 [Aphanomyces astaci]
MAKHHPDLIMCRKQPGIAIGRLCEKDDGKCVICDSYVKPQTLVRVCDECNYGTFQGRCVICGGTILRMKKTDVKPKKKTPSLKNKIRNLERFLKKDVKELKELQRQTEGKQEEDKSREITLKYKKVRFFDRRRLMRSLKKLKRQLDAVVSNEADNTSEIEKEFQQAKEDMMYVYYYPKGERYINLFPEAKKPHSNEDLARQTTLKKAALKAFKKDADHTAFDHYCFNDDDAPVDDTKKVEKKRKVGKDGKPKRKEKRRKSNTERVNVVADMDDAVAGAGGEDDFFL